MELTLFIATFLYLWLAAERCSTNIVRRYAEEELDSAYWYNVGEKTLKQILKQQLQERPAKNVVYFLGDGMGIPTVTAARIYDGQKKGMTGEENSLEFEAFPNVGLAKTYNVDKQVPDSAGTSTAFLCGVKGNYYTLGVTARVNLDNCTAAMDQSTHVKSILHWAQNAGKATGFVTTMRVTHATPAGLYAHSANRGWEADANIPEDKRQCVDIATQLVEHEPGRNCKVIMGGGRKKFLPKNGTGVGERLDGKNLIDRWEEKSREKQQRYKVVMDLNSFNDVNPSETDCLLGLFNDDHLTYEGDWLNKSLTRNEPTLSEMTKKSIEILLKSPDGFFLFVEGGKIDWAHHAGTARYALEETVAFNEAIRLATSMVDLEETLVIVTADHSHVMTINGYPHRGNDILGSVMSEPDDPLPDLTYTTLMYANGPGYSYPPPNGTGIFKSGENTTVFSYRQLAAFPKKYESHGGEDVPVYAIGPMSHIFRGVYEQNYIPHAIGYVACYKGNFEKCLSTGTASFNTMAPPILLLASIVVYLHQRIACSL